MNITLEALRGKLVIKKDEPGEKSPGGIVIPDVCRDKPMTGIVKSVGPGAIDEEGRVQPMEVNVGDRVIFPKYSGTNVTIEGQEFFVVAEKDCLAIVPGAN